MIELSERAERVERLVAKATSLRRSAIEVSAGSMNLSRHSALWLIRAEAWGEMVRALPFDCPAPVDLSSKRIFDLPVRLTVDDDNEVPDIQLVMEPLMYRFP